MNAESAKSSWQLTMCPSCGAAVASDAQRCWLCTCDLSEETLTAEVVSQPPGYVQQSRSSRIALIVGIVTMGLVTAGVFAAAPGIGVLMGIVFVIAVFAVGKGLQSADTMTADQAAIKHAYASPTAVASGGQGSAIAAVFKVLGIIALIILASVIALFTFCVIFIAVLTAG